MKYQVIASGSKGNLIYIETKETKVLIDAGISYKQAAIRTGIDFSKIDAILVTHEHIDHIKELSMYLKKTKAVLYVNSSSFKEIVKKGKSNYSNYKVCYIDANTKYQIKDLVFMPINLSHDTVNCYGFIFINGNDSLAYIADTGFIALPYIELLKKVRHIIIEANHDIEMLNNSERPLYLKQRILSIEGHMSNITCGEVLNTILTSKTLECITLAHLSEECNTPEIAVDTVLEKIKGDYIPVIKVAKQKEAMPLIDISDFHES